jgi:hypothetical protein
MTDRSAAALAAALPERVECKGEYKWTAQDGKVLYSTERYLSREEIAGWILVRLALAGYRLVHEVDPPQTFAEHTAEALALIHDHVEVPE